MPRLADRRDERDHPTNFLGLIKMNLTISLASFPANWWQNWQQLDQLGVLPPDLSELVMTTFSHMTDFYQAFSFYETLPASENNLAYLDDILRDHYNSSMSILLPLIEKLSDFARVPRPTTQMEGSDQLITEQAKRLVERMTEFNRHMNAQPPA